jgi:hypothetical protein
VRVAEQQSNVSSNLSNIDKPTYLNSDNRLTIIRKPTYIDYNLTKIEKRAT